MAKGVATVWLPVQDMSRALQFYGQTLDLTVTSEGDNWSEIDANGLTIGLNAREDTPPADSGGAVITFQPDVDLYGEVVRLTEAGVRFAGEVAQHSWGRVATFKDSEGNDLQLYEPLSRD